MTPSLERDIGEYHFRADTLLVERVRALKARAGYFAGEGFRVAMPQAARALSPSATEPLRVSSLTGDDRYRGEGL